MIGNIVTVVLLAIMGALMAMVVIYGMARA